MRSRGLELGVGGDVWETFFFLKKKKKGCATSGGGRHDYIRNKIFLRGWVSEKVWITQKRGGIVDEDRSWV